MARRINGEFDEWAAYLNATLDAEGMTPNALADATGIKVKTIYNWTGARGSASADMAVMVAEALHRPYAEVLLKAGHPRTAATYPKDEDPGAETEPPPMDPVVERFLSIPGLSDEDKWDYIELHMKRRARLLEADVAAAEAAADGTRRESA